jgi:oxygen-independent coproporphyrinogen III oxidase
MKLLEKYDVPAPRYTSYPTVPCWNHTPSQEEWKRLVSESFSHTNHGNGISVYIHLPFCESLCTYCACNTRITVNHKVEMPYIETILEEWKLYLSLFNGRPLIRELHLGGGTPTFFSPRNLQYLVSEILKTTELCLSHDFSFEGHPGNTTKEHLKVLYDLGFRRVSFGIQDFDHKVQVAIHRLQDLTQVQNVVELARKIGYSSVNFDLVYGLPFQNISTMETTVQKVIRLRPDRIAFYSYAHVPWMRPGQRKYTASDLPAGAEKRALYELGVKAFNEAGYEEVGLDHFALPGDALLEAKHTGMLHRNFMGYTSQFTKLMISLGASAISDCGTAFSQNHKVVEEYQSMVASKKFPITKGHVLDNEDMVIRRLILDIMCRQKSCWDQNEGAFGFIQKGLERCSDLEADGLIVISANELVVTEKGRPFLRNICLCFDERSKSVTADQPRYSTVA